VPNDWTGTTSHAFFKLSNEVLGTYNLHDSRFTAELVPVLLRELEDLGQLDNYQRWVQPLARAVVNMQHRGILVDKGALHDYKRQVRQELARADKIILAGDVTGVITGPTGKSPNGIGSTKRLREYLYGTLGLKPGKKTTGGDLSTDQETLGGILKNLRKKDEHARGIIEQLFHRSRLKTISQRYLNFPIDSDGRVRASVNMAKVKTWRFSYDNPALQQYPPECRHIFRAGPGKVFLAADYSQLEARILAYLSNDEVSIRAFVEGRDIHNQNARDLFDYDLATWEQLSSNGGAMASLARNFAKTFLYGISYGAATETLKLKEYCPCAKCQEHAPQTLSLKRTELKKVEVAWFQKHSAVRVFHEKLKAQVQSSRYWDCPLGGRRVFFQPWSAELDRETKNAPMQTTAACLMNQKQVELDRLGAPIVLQRHDEFVFEIPENEIPKWTDICQTVMAAPLEDAGILTGISFPIDIKVGETWGTLKKLAATTQTKRPTAPTQ